MKGGEPIFKDNNSKVGVLMIHGFTSTPHQFKELSQFLSSSGFTVYAPLVAGHGTSPEEMLKTTSKDWSASVKSAYLKLKEKAEKVVIIGNSFGGNLAFWLAKEMKEDDMLGIVSLGTPITLRYQALIEARYHLYGWAKKYYKKPMRVYKTDYTDMMDEVTYPVIPVKCLGEFLRFIKNETIPNLDKVKVPVFVAHANIDPVVHPKSAEYIYENLGSYFKRMHWIESNCHDLSADKNSKGLFEEVLGFIKEISQNDIKKNGI